MGLGQADIPGTPQLAGSYRSGDGALYTGALGVLDLEFSRLFPLPRCLQSLILLFGPDGQAPARVLGIGLCAQLTARTGPAVAGGKLQPYNVIAAVVYKGCPLDALLSFGAGGLLALPIDLEVLHAETLLCASLPTVVRAGGSVEIHPVVLLALGQKLGVEVASVHKLGLWQQTLLF